MQRFTGLSRLRCLPLLSTLRTFSNNKNLDLDKIFGDLLSKEDKLKLGKKMEAVQRDTYDQAMPSQLSELAVDMDRLIQRGPKKQPFEPSRSKLLNDGTKATRLLRLEVYSRAMSEGLSEIKARAVSDKIVERAAVLFEEKANKTVEGFEKEAEKRKADEDELNDKEKKLLEFASQRIEEMFAPQKQREFKPRADFGCVSFDPNAEKIFGDTNKALNYFNLDKLTPAPTSYWAQMEKRKTEITNLSMGPTNAFEEQIIWTEQGRMWPYPIDNEYLIGEEENISFKEHIFIDKYLTKNYSHLPKNGPVAHFMELVCVGLSKNPYMTLAKKHMHLDSYAEFFNP